LNLTMSGDVEITPWDAELADEAMVEGYYRLVVAAAAVDRPDELPLMTRAAIVGRLRTPLRGQEAAQRWVARKAAQVVGVAAAGFLEDENHGIARVEVLTHPEVRRRGIGTELLAAAVTAVRAAGRRVVQGAVLKDGPGPAWGAALGFQVVHETVLQELVLATSDRSGRDVGTPAGYQLRWWAGHTPPELLASYAAARNAIGDAPLGESTEQAQQWTAERVQTVEDDLRRRHVEQLIVTAIHTATGAVAGLTEIEIYPHRPTIAYQGDTAVLAEHRGHQLGLALKTQMLNWLTSQRPTIERIYTSSAATNTHMLRVNRTLGFTVHRGVLVLEHSTHALTTTLANRPA
jgi:mycothiol synthase